MLFVPGEQWTIYCCTHCTLFNLARCEVPKVFMYIHIQAICTIILSVPETGLYVCAKTSRSTWLELRGLNTPWFQGFCHAAGLQFVPMVVEACGGGWAPATVKGREPAVHADIALQRKNTRAALLGWKLGEVELFWE